MSCSRRALLMSFAPQRNSFADLEAKSGGRLGVAVLDTGSGRIFGHRLDERFALCSTFKLLLAATVLREADRGRLNREEVLPITPSDILPVSPVSSPFVGKGLSITALAEGTQKTSDNAAGNILLRKLGGPAAFTRLLRDAGDPTTRLDRYELDLNRVPPGDPRDTTTPRAMARTAAAFLTGNLLKPDSRDLLARWMVETETGLKRIRAGLPKDWRAGDKTGTGRFDDIPDKVNDVAVCWPPGRPPVIITAYYEKKAADEDTLAAAGRIAVETLLSAPQSR